MELEFTIQLQNDDELLQKLGVVDDGRVVFDRFQLWIPKLTPKYSIANRFTDDFLIESKWTYSEERYQKSAPTHSSGFFRISLSIDNVKAV